MGNTTCIEPQCRVVAGKQSFGENLLSFEENLMDFAVVEL